MIKIVKGELLAKDEYRPTGEWVSENDWRSLSVYSAEVDDGGEEIIKTRLIQFEDGRVTEKWNEYILFPLGLFDNRSGEDILDDFDITKGLKIKFGEYVNYQDIINYWSLEDEEVIIEE